MPDCSCVSNLCENLKWKYREGCLEGKKNILVAALCGALFFTGWWIMFDLAAQRPHPSHFQAVYYICGVTNTVAVFMINMVTKSHLRRGGRTDAIVGPYCALTWLFMGFIMLFASLIGAGWILFMDYIIPGNAHKDYGIAIFFQNLLIFVSGMTYKFGRSEDLWGDLEGGEGNFM